MAEILKKTLKDLELSKKKDEDDEESDIETEPSDDDEEQNDYEEDEEDDEDEDEDDNEPNDDEIEGEQEEKENSLLDYGLNENDDEDEEEEDENYLQKINKTTRENIIAEHHPELIGISEEEVETLCQIVRNTDGVIIDPFHRTLPFITKYEKARILGERAKQLNAGATSFIEIDPSIIDGYLIALKEFEQKKIPFIVQRPLPGGGCEFWRLADLEIID
jgi:DNA-directed RNA polymerase subunit K/omega